ncbi:MAG: MOSC domain-containing protein [Thioalkalivibrio sp.]
MVTVGRIKEIWRYPVKGMAGERIDACSVDERGIGGDRTWALRDVAREEVQSCKTRPQLLTCSARATGDGQVEVTLPDGSTLGSDHARIHERLSALTGKASTLEPLRPAADAYFYRRHKRDEHSWFQELAATFDREPGEPLPDFDLNNQDFADFVSRPGSFFLVTPLHLLTTATLKHLADLNPDGDWDARRFRANFLIDTEASHTGLTEQDWVGRRLVIGGAAMDCVSTTPRCGAITRPQREFAADTGILRTVVKAADQNVGVYGETIMSGDVCVGDTVCLI